MDYNEFIKPELLVLVPVLFFIGEALKNGAFTDKYIPLTLGTISVILCTLWIIGNSQVRENMFMALFTAITQGILLAGAAVYADQIIKQAKKEE